MSTDAPPVNSGSSLLLRLPRGGFIHERTLWKHHRLLFQMVRSDLRSRYVATSMGFFWSVIHPLLLLLVYIFVFSFIFKAKWESLGFLFEGNFAVYFCCGMLPWVWFSDSLSGASNSIVSHAHLIRKNIFPTIILPMQHIMSGMFNFAIIFALFLLYRLTCHSFPGRVILLLPLVILLQFIFMVGFSYVLAVINVFWRDASQILTSMLMIWLWLTPIFYLPKFVLEPVTSACGATAGEIVLWAFRINPVFHLVTLYQRIFFFVGDPREVQAATGLGDAGQSDWLRVYPDPWVSVVYLFVLSLILWFLARRLYGRAEPRIVEVV